MCQRKVVKRFLPLHTRIIGKNITLPSRVQSQLDKVIKIKSFPKGILLVGNSSKRSLTAAYLDSRLGKPVFRVDLSAIVSKYISETEKNLVQLFSKAERKDWILFFDEADVLFGKRTTVMDASDRFANVDTNWLLQKMEAHEGLIILGSNEKGRISDDIVERLKLVEILNTSDEKEDENDSDE